MASEVAEFLWNKFLKTFEDSESELQSGIISHFTEIKQEMEIQNRKKKMCSPTDSSIYPLLYNLNDSISECRVFAQQRNSLSKNAIRFNPLMEFYFVQMMKRRLARIKSGFLKIAKQEKDGGEQISDLRRRKEGNASKIIGFDKHKVKYVDKLLEDEAGFKAIGIYGMGGSGKTTLAGEIYNTKRVRSEFSRRIWVPLSDTVESNEPEIGGKVVKLVLKALRYDSDRLTSNTSLDDLLVILNDELKSERYLIVLDDVLIIYEFWDLFLKALPVNPGGALIVTSSLEEVARRIVGEENLFHIPPLDREDCWQIFMNTIYENRSIPLDHHILTKIEEEIKDQFHGLPLAAKTLAKIIPKRIQEIFEPNHVLEEFSIPRYMFIPEPDVTTDANTPECPVLVFIDTKEEQLGEELLVTFRSLLNINQVIDLEEENPDKVLARVYCNLEMLKSKGLHLAIEIQEKLRILVVGGDAAVNGLLGTICDLKLLRPPSIAPMPLGSENDLTFSFGWGKKNPGADRPSVVSFLKQVEKAKEMKIDSWHILIRMWAPKEGSCDPIAPLQLPRCLHAFQCVSETDELNREGYHTFRGGLWNYFSIGIHAQVSYAFNQLEEFKKLAYQNQSTSARRGCIQGWFSKFSRFFDSLHLNLTTRWRHASGGRGIASYAKIKIMKKYGQWQDVHIPYSITSMICLNLPSFSGGMNPWGRPSRKRLRDRDLTPSYVDDGLLEVVGFRDDLLGLLQLGPNRRGIRIAQAHRIRFEFHKSALDHTYMKIDGQAWKQPLPLFDDVVVVEISHHGQVNVLATYDCRSASVNDPSSPTSFWDEDNSSEEESLQNEEQRKFGAAATFRIPDAIDISHLS